MNITQCINALSKTDLFRVLTDVQFKQVIDDNKTSMKSYKKDQVVHIQSELCNMIDIVIKGEVAVQKIDENGNVLTVSLFSSLDILGVNLVFATKNIYPMTVSAHTDVIMVHVNRITILKVSQDNHGFLMQLLKAVSDKALLLTDKINQISLQTIRTRITKYLAFERCLQGSDVIKLNTTKKNLAEKFGIQRSSLSRELNKMRAEGLIDFDAKTIIIKNLII